MIQNNGFEAGNLTGWTLTTGTNAAASNAKAYIGTYSLAIGPTSSTVATVLMSSKIMIPPGRNLFYLYWVSWNTSAVAIAVAINTYDLAGTLVGGLSIGNPSGQVGWNQNNNYAVCPPQGGYAVITITAPANVTLTAGYLDEFLAYIN